MSGDGASNVKWGPGGFISDKYESLLQPAAASHGPCEGGREEHSATETTSSFTNQPRPQAPVVAPAHNRLFKPNPTR
ncbi:MAG: hypothetical protein U1F57_01190 [bacterium]